MGFSEMADRMVWTTIFVTWPKITTRTVTKCTHSRMVGLRVEGSFVSIWRRPFDALTVNTNSQNLFLDFSELWLVFRKGHHASYGFIQHARNILSAVQLRWFWISWSHGVISCGRGNRPGLQSFGSYNDPAPYSVNYMSISSYYQTTAYWVIPGELYNSTPGI